MQDQDEPHPAEASPSNAKQYALDAATDILAGLAFAGLGLAALVVGRTYPMGTSLDMGPGYLPRIVAAALVITGVVVAARGVRRRAFKLPDFNWRAAGWIGAAILLFAGLVERTGLFVACLACVVVAALGDARSRRREVPLVAGIVAGFCALLFGYLLKLPIRIWPL